MILRSKTSPICRAALAAFALALSMAHPQTVAAQEAEQPGLFGGFFGNDRSREERPRGEPRGGYAQMDAGDLTVRLDRLEGQLRQLTGSIEQLQFRNQQLEQQVKRSQEDVEFRFQELGGKPGAARPAAQSPGASRPPSQPSAAPPPAAQPAPPPPSGRRSDAFDPNENPNAPGAPRPMGTVSGPPPVVAQDEVGVRGGRQAGAPLDLSTLSERAASDPSLDPDRSGSVGSSAPGPVASAPQAGGQLPPPPPRNPNATGSQQAALPPSATPRDEFALAQGYVQRKEYAQAEEGLRDFIKKHPNDRLVSDANFWLGESFFQRQRYRDAAESFLTVSTKFESSGKAPDALLRLGQSLAALGEKEAACATFGEMDRKFPRASNGVKQGVAREQKRVKC